MRADLKDRLDRCRTLPTLPALALKVLELCQQDDLNLNEIAAVIGNDPALAAKLLRMANSPVSGLKRPARTVSHALALLGVNTVRTLALSFSLASDLKKTGKGVQQAVWKRSILAAISAREVARVVESRLAEEAFLAALLQDIGGLALAQIEPKVCAANWEKAQGDHTLLIDLEREAFGTDHAEVTQWLLTRWKLPGLFSEAAGTSHDVDGAKDTRDDGTQIEKIVRLSGWIADIWIREEAAPAIEVARLRAQSILNLGEERLAPVFHPFARYTHRGGQGRGRAAARAHRNRPHRIRRRPTDEGDDFRGELIVRARFELRLAARARQSRGRRALRRQARWPQSRRRGG
jgi:HD-like signal output (HDOD) protein